MIELYQKITYFILSMFSGRMAEAISITLLVSAGWISIKRKSFRFATILIFLSALISFGSTLFAFFRGQ